jgi:hypothetical protein
MGRSFRLRAVAFAELEAIGREQRCEIYENYDD